MTQTRFVSSFGLCVLMVSLSACTYLIPDDPSVPRYNQVLGERHRPQKNIDKPTEPSGDDDVAAKAVGAGSENKAPTVPMAAPVPQVTENNLPALPPVDASTKARANAEIAAGAAPSDPNARHVPSENPGGDFAQNDTAPPISTVPPRPPLTGSDAPAARMNNIRHELEGERGVSNDAAAKLSKDAASEPTITPPPPAPGAFAVPMPPAPPVASANTPTVSFRPTPVASLPPTEQVSVQEVPPPLPPATSAAMPPPPPMLMASAPPPPTAYASSGDFDPMAVTGTSQSTATARAGFATSDFLPPSRYASHR